MEQPSRTRNRDLQDAAEAADEARIQVEDAWLAVKAAEDAYSQKQKVWQSAVHKLDGLVQPRTAADLTQARGLAGVATLRDAAGQARDKAAG